jgi:hypothetical protein
MHRTYRLQEYGGKAWGMANLATLLEMSAAMQALAHATSDHKEAVAAILGKRRPSFHGR